LLERAEISFFLSFSFSGCGSREEVDQEKREKENKRCNRASVDFGGGEDCDGWAKKKRRRVENLPFCVSLAALVT